MYPYLPINVPSDEAIFIYHASSSIFEDNELNLENLFETNGLEERLYILYITRSYILIYISILNRL